MSQRLAEMRESPVLKVARGETTTQGLAAVNDSRPRAPEAAPSYGAISVATVLAVEERSDQS